jgi:hypothetical protein
LAVIHHLAPQHYGALAAVSRCYSPPKGKFLRVTHPSATAIDKIYLVRLACVKHTASVHPEPGSNSPKNFKDTIKFKININCINKQILSLIEKKTHSIDFYNLCNCKYKFD